MEISITAMKSLKISVFLSVSLECSLLILNFCGKPRRRASGGAGYVLPVDKNRVALSWSGRCRTAQAKEWFFACLPACRQGYNADPRRRAAARRRRTPGVFPASLASEQGQRARKTSALQGYGSVPYALCKYPTGPIAEGAAARIPAAPGPLPSTRW